MLRRVMISKILVPVDGSEHANKAMQYALDLAKKYEAKVTLIHIVARPLYAYDAAIAVDVSSSLLAEGREILRRAQEMLDRLGFSAESKLVEGNPAEEILRLADSEQSDLIVMGSRGLNPVKAFFLGSVSNRVSHYAKCPVLIVK